MRAGTGRRTRAGDEEREARDERGFTLVEMLVTVWIIGAAVVAMVSGMFTMVKASDVQRRTAVAETQLRRLVEVVRAAPYVPCTGSGGMSVAAYTNAYTGAGTDTVVIDADTVTVDSALDVSFWRGSYAGDAPNLGDLSPTCPPGGDTGIQAFSLRVTVAGVPDVRVHPQYVVKRDNR